AVAVGDRHHHHRRSVKESSTRRGAEKRRARDAGRGDGMGTPPTHGSRSPQLCESVAFLRSSCSKAEAMRPIWLEVRPMWLASCRQVETEAATSAAMPWA